MKFKHYLERVEESSEFRKFKEENPKAYLCAGFFVLDFETDQNLHQIDYFLPNKKVATFLLDEGAKLKISEQALKKKLPEIKQEPKTDLDALKGIVEDGMKNKTITERIRKMIAILHIIDDRLIWNVQCILEGLGFLSVHIDDSDQSILKLEKHSLLDLIKTPGQGMGGMMMQPKPEQHDGEGHVPGGMPAEEMTPEQQAEREEKARQILNQIKDAIEKAKKKAQKEEKAKKKTPKKKAKKR